MRVEDKVRCGQDKLIILVLLLSIPVALYAGTQKGIEQTEDRYRELAIKDANCACCMERKSFSDHKWIGQQYTAR